MILKYTARNHSKLKLINRSVSTLNFNYQTFEKISKQLNCFININSEANINDQINKSRERSEKGTSLSNLEGVTLAIKDNISVKGLPTTCSSKYLKDFKAPQDATCVKLLKESGCVILGKTNLDEFGMGSSNLYSHFGACKHPFHDNLVPGGSSGGSACSVASKLTQVSLGSDTGGSVRLPASYCGIYGFKPSYGRISRFGLISYANSLDTIGILSSDLNLLKQTYNQLNKPDTLDSTCLTNSIREEISEKANSIKFLKTQDLKDITIGIPKEYNIAELDTLVKAEWQNSISKLSKLGAKIVEVSLPHTKYALPAYYIIALAEASSNLARYDGIKYGYRTPGDVSNFMEQVSKSRLESLGEEVQKRILLGTFTLSHGAYEDYFKNAQKVRTLVQQDFDNVFKFKNLISNTEANTASGVDAILAPTTFSPPPSRDNLPKGVNAYTNDVFTVPSSLAGLPSISVPSRESEIPIGMQLIGQFGTDDLVLSLANHI